LLSSKLNLSGGGVSMAELAKGLVFTLSDVTLFCPFCLKLLFYLQIKNFKLKLKTKEIPIMLSNPSSFPCF
jgi:hypothetical protein